MVLRGDRFKAAYGWAEAVPPVDFETYSEAGFQWDETHRAWRALEGADKTKRGLECVGVKAYVNHPTFDVLSLSYDLLDGKGWRHWTPTPETKRITEETIPYGNEHPWELLAFVRNGGIIEAWYVGFEATVWNDYCVPVWGWPPLLGQNRRCAMAKARAHALPGKLGETGRVLQLNIQKDPEGKRLIKKFCEPRKPTILNPRKRIKLSDDIQDAQKLFQYNVKDILAETEASLHTPDLPEEELENWMVDQIINERGIGVNMQGVDDCIAIVEQAFAKYNAELAEITNHMVREASELEKLKGWLRSQGFNINSLTKDTLPEILTWELPPNVRRALEIREALSSASIHKLYAFRHQSVNGRLYWLYMFFAARTGRWAGNGPQPQNLPKGFFKSAEECQRALAVIALRSLEVLELAYPGRTALEVIGGCLRGLLVAAPGHRFICSDFAAIEGVITAAIAGEEWRLNVFRTHGLIYETSASKICGIPLEEFTRHKQETKQHHPMRAKIGKFAELACGFGGWIGAMVNFGADEFLSEKEMEDAIKAWRRESPWIVEAWGGQSRRVSYDNYREELYGLEGAMIAAIQNPGRAYAYRQIIYQMHEDILYCRVPSGGLITYHKPRLGPSERSFWTPPWHKQASYEGWNTNPKNGPVGWIRMRLYGGKCMEHVVQRSARDVQAKALRTVEQAGYRPVLHSHDEIAGEAPYSTPGLSVEHFEIIVNQSLPQWAALPDGRPWPIKMKGGWEGPMYGKFE